MVGLEDRQTPGSGSVPARPLPQREPQPPGSRRTPLFLRPFLQEDVNFLLTNRIPRRLATMFMGWFSRIRFAPVRAFSMAIWKMFDRELDLGEARETRFASMHDCFIRELRDGARPIDADAGVLTSPCDAIVGAMGRIAGTEVFQAKGFPYTLMDLLGDDDLVAKHRDGNFVTLRIKSSMYHRFHAPCDGAIRGVDYISGDTWNVNPIALRRVERLFCKNERAVLDLDLPDRRGAVTLVPVAAILVASIKLHFLEDPLHLRYAGPNHIECDVTFRKGEELGYFQHGSTIIVFASDGFDFCDDVIEGTRIRVGEPLLRRTGPGQ